VLLTVATRWPPDDSLPSSSESGNVVALNGSPGLSNKKKRLQFAATFVNGPLQGTTLIGCCLPAIEREAVHSAMSSSFDYFTLNDVGRASNSPDLTNVSS
jgi:hypothetical protein